MFEKSISNEWHFYAQRPEIAPKYWIDKKVKFNKNHTLALAGDGQFYSNGCWTKIFDTKAENYVQFSTYFQTKNVDEKNRNVLARILWLIKSQTLASWKIFTPGVNCQCFCRQTAAAECHEAAGHHHGRSPLPGRGSAIPQRPCLWGGLQPGYGLHRESWHGEL